MQEDVILGLLSNLGVAKVSSGYKNQAELLEDCSAILDYNLYLLKKYDFSRKNFTAGLTDNSAGALFLALDSEELEQIEINTQVFSLRLDRTDIENIPLINICKDMNFNYFETMCIVFVIIIMQNYKYKWLLPTFGGDGSSIPVQILIRMLTNHEFSETKCKKSFENVKFCAVFDDNLLKKGFAVLNEYSYNIFDGKTDIKLDGIQVFLPNASLNKIVVRMHEYKNITDALGGNSENRCITIYGEAGAGKRFFVKHACKSFGMPCVFVDLENDDALQLIKVAQLIATMIKGILCAYNADLMEDDEKLIAKIGKSLAKKELYNDTLFLLSQKNMHINTDRVNIKVELNQLDMQQCLKLFLHYGSNFKVEQEGQLEQCAAKFRFEPLAIELAMRQATEISIVSNAPISTEQLHKCCYDQSIHKLDLLADKIIITHKWEDVILPKAQKDLLQSACDHVTYKRKIYDQWGFGRRVSYGKGVSMLFAGPPGTGKTMSAQIVANKLNMQLYKIQISQVISKYIGETEKNLRAVFLEAKRSSAILFFDECDAIFSKRSDVKDSHDRNANLEVAYLLQEVEEYDGISILATNLMQNIDSAFIRRISFVVNFPFPDKDMRKLIFKSMLTDNVPVDDDIDWDFLAQKVELSGGSIKNIVVNAAFSAAAKNTSIDMELMLKASVDEMRKSGMLVSREDIKQYADLVF